MSNLKTNLVINLANLDETEGESPYHEWLAPY